MNTGSEGSLSGLLFLQPVVVNSISKKNGKKWSRTRSAISTKLTNTLYKKNIKQVDCKLLALFAKKSLFKISIPDSGSDSGFCRAEVLESGTIDVLQQRPLWQGFWLL